MTTSERLLNKLKATFPNHPALSNQDNLFLVSNKSYVRFGACFNWLSSGYPAIFSYYTMTECLKNGELAIAEHYERNEFQGYLVYPKKYDPYRI